MNAWTMPISTPSSRNGIGSSVFLVLITELLNSGIESAVDRVSSERHPLSGRAKDLGSAAVFVALFNMAMVWGLVLFL